MRALGFAVSKAEVKGLMAEYGKDEGGGLELHEFMEISEWWAGGVVHGQEEAL